LGSVGQDFILRPIFKRPGRSKRIAADLRAILKQTGIHPNDFLRA